MKSSSFFFLFVVQTQLTPFIYQFIIQGQACGGESPDQQLIDDFHNIDVDNNGFISLEELNQASIQEGGDEVTPEQWRLMCEYVEAKEHIGITYQNFKQIHSMGSGSNN